MIQKIDHIGIAVKDLETAKTYFEDALGLRCEGIEEVASQKVKTAFFDAGGVHLELTGEDVTECTGGARALTEVDLERAYRSTVDPRLNYEQALETAMLIVRKHAQLNPPIRA